MRRVSGAIALACLVAGQAWSQTEERTIRGTDVVIYNLVGRMRAVPGSGDAVTVEIARAGADAGKLRIETGALRGRETLRIVYPSDEIVYPEYRGSRTSMSVREDGTFGDWSDYRWRERVTVRGRGPGLEAWADLVVRVPRGQKVSLHLGVGRVEVGAVDADLSVDAASADVDVTGAKGTLTLDSGSGRVVVRDVSGDVSADVGSGGITLDRVTGTVLRLDSGSGGIDASQIVVREFSADVGSGGVRVSGLQSPVVTIETGSGGASVDCTGPLERLRVESGSGSVTLRVPADLSAEIDAETGSGGFQTDFEIVTRRFGRNHVQGRIGDGKGRISLESGSGTIRLLKR